jgi:hypothetical protein
LASLQIVPTTFTVSTKIEGEPQGGDGVWSVTATEEELQALETALGLPLWPAFDAHTLRVIGPTGRVRGMPEELPRRVQATLRAFVLRNHTAAIEARRRLTAGARERRRQAARPIIVGDLPGPFSRPGWARGAGSRDNDMAWIGLPLPPPKPRIELPMPPERELIDLPMPKRRRQPDE